MTPVRRRLRALAATTLVVATAIPLTAGPVAAAGSVSLTTLGTAYTQDFDTLASSGTTNTAVPTGWEFSESGTNANTTYRAGTGSDNTGDTYSFGATSSAERAFGGLRSGSLVPLIGAQLTNNTGATITSLDVAYTGEQWRLGQNTTGRAADRLDFQYSTDATSITTGTWTDVNALDFSSPVVAGTVGALNGNASANRSALSASITGLSVANASTVWIRWADSDLIPGADDGLSVDDLSITPRGASLPALSIGDVTADEGNAGTTSFDFMVSLGAPAGPGGVSFDIATADDTATTANNDYTAKSTTAATIAAGASSTTFSVSVNGDTTPEATEAFRVNVTNVTGATVADAQGTGTITNDDADPAPTVSGSVPADGATNVPRGQTLSVTFSEPVTVTSPWYTLECSTSGTVSTTYAGGPTTFSIDPSADLAYGETCTLTILAGAVSDQDGIDPPDSMTLNFTVGFSTELDPCTQPYTAIPAIQGSGATVALTGTRTTQGVVVGDYEGPSPALRGFYLQDPTGDGNPATSDGIFVFEGSNANTVSVGDVVRVTGTASENQGQSQVSVGTIIKCGTGSVEPTDVTFPAASADALERYEGMLVRLPQTMTVTEHFQLGRFGQVVLSSSGKLAQPTNVVAPGAAANALQAQNNLDRIILDDASQAQNPDPIVFGRGGQPLSASNTLRGGDTATGIVGVMMYTWAGNAAGPNAYRVRPGNALGGTGLFEAANPRPTTAPEVGGTTRVAGMNLLNYFNTFDGLPDTVDTCRNGTTGALTDCRGADTASEFARQWPKTVAAILQIDPDVLGVNEIENDGYGSTSAIADLVSHLNDATAPGTYAFIDADAATGVTDVMGSDAIKVGLLYKPGVVTPVGTTAVLNTTAFVNGGDGAARSRPSIAQAFEVNATGGRFIVDTNHLKSKGSACDAPDAGDGQGNCNAVRVAAATELASWLATDPTGTGDPDVLIIGDLNSYAMEDPVRTLENAGYTNLVSTFIGPDAYSYVFDGQWGYLDHALGSPSIVGQVTGIGEYHINADEPSVLDYNTDFKSAGQVTSLYAADEYRVSDHDPVVIGLEVGAPPVVDEPAVTPEPSVEGQTVTASATFSDNDTDTYTCTVDYGDGSGEVAGTIDGTTCTGPDHAYATYGEYTVTVSVTDDDGTGSNTTLHDVNFAFTGFFQPVDMTGLNQVKAGASVPFKFSLGGDKGTAILAAGSPSSVRVTCDSSAPIDPIEETATAGSSGLRYDAATGMYVYTWKTSKQWAGTCREITVTLVDGTSHTALFSFIK